MAKKEIYPDYIYITIPAEYVCVYHRLLELLTEYGIDMLKDCKASCKDRNQNIIDCYNMFNSAVAARKLGLDAGNNYYIKLAKTLINYVDATLKTLYNKPCTDKSFTIMLDKHDGVEAIVHCNPPSFEIDYVPEPEPIPIIPSWYVGQINKTKSQFSALSVEELLAVSQLVLGSTKTISFEINHSCWFIMVPVITHVISAQYTDSGITTVFTQNEIENGFITDVYHEDVEIANNLYHVYVNRSVGLIDSGVVGQFTIN